MCVISPMDLLLEYMYDAKQVESSKLMTDIERICQKIGQKDIHTPIDFNCGDEYPESDVLTAELWSLQTGGVIKVIQGSVIYSITKKGMRLTEKYRAERIPDETNTWSIVRASIKDVLRY